MEFKQAFFTTCIRACSLMCVNLVWSIEILPAWFHKFTFLEYSLFTALFMCIMVKSRKCTSVCMCEGVCVYVRGSMCVCARECVYECVGVCVWGVCVCGCMCGVYVCGVYVCGGVCVGVYV